MNKCIFDQNFEEIPLSSQFFFTLYKRMLMIFFKFFIYIIQVKREGEKKTNVCNVSSYQELCKSL